VTGTTASARSRTVRSRSSLALALGVRAGIAAATAMVITFQENQFHDDKSTAFRGLLIFGVFAVLQGLSVGLGVRLLPTGAGRLLATLRIVVSVALGVVALAEVHAGLGVLLLIVTVWFVVSGALELVGGIRRPDRSIARDGVVVGVVALICALTLSIAPPDLLLTMGMVATWGAVTAVYLGIAAASTRRTTESAT
jgi:uncharacterized membrane protein HdeD (DUF308 family)